MDEIDFGYTDEEMIEKYREKKPYKLEYLLEKYKYVVKYKAKNLFLPGADHEDLIQEGMIGLFKAIRDFDIKKEVKFSTFATLCITRQLQTAIESATRLKHGPLNDYVSVNGVNDLESVMHNLAYQERMGAKESTPEEMLIEKEAGEVFQELCAKELSKFEINVLTLYLKGLTTKEIANILGKNEKSTDNALQRGKLKLKKILDKKD